MFKGHAHWQAGFRGPGAGPVPRRFAARCLLSGVNRKLQWARGHLVQWLRRTRRLSGSIGLDFRGALPYADQCAAAVLLRSPLGDAYTAIVEHGSGSRYVAGSMPFPGVLLTVVPMRTIATAHFGWVLAVPTL